MKSCASCSEDTGLTVAMKRDFFLRSQQLLLLKQSDNPYAYGTPIIFVYNSKSAFAEISLPRQHPARRRSFPPHWILRRGISSAQHSFRAAFILNRTLRRIHLLRTSFSAVRRNNKWQHCLLPFILTHIHDTVIYIQSPSGFHTGISQHSRQALLSCTVRLWGFWYAIRPPMQYLYISCTINSKALYPGCK